MDKGLQKIKEQYPEYKDWSDDRLSTALKHKQQTSGTGWSGIANDAGKSAENFFPAMGDMISSIKPGIENVGKYAMSHNPVETLGNLGAGVVEAAAGLLSGPQKGAQYLGEKFPALGRWMEKNAVSPTSSYKTPTLYEGLMNFEKEHGLGARSEEEGSVRNLGGLLSGGKYMSKLGSPTGNIASLASETAGRGGDPLQAALMGLGGHFIAKAPWKKVANAPIETLKKTPEMLMKGAASAAETAGDIGHKFHIPGIQPSMGIISSYLKHKAVGPEEFARRQLFSDIEQTQLPQIQERVAAAKRLGLSYLTPAEATLSPFEAAKQGEVGRTPPGSRLLFEKGSERSTSEGQAITNLFDTIHNDAELEPKKQAAYEETMSASVPDTFVEKFKKDPVIEEAIDKLHNDAAYRKSLGIEKKEKGSLNTPQSTFEYWDHIKRILGDMEESNASGEGRKPFKKSVIADTRREMVKEMDAIKPEYKIARGIAERKFTRKKLENVFDKKRMTINNFKAILGSHKKFNEIVDKLKAFPEAKKKLNDMKLLFGETGLGNMIPNDVSIRTATEKKRTGMSDARNDLDALKRALDEKYGRKHDVAIVKLMTNPEWITEYLKHSKK